MRWYNVSVMEAMLEKIDIPPFPLDDEERLEQLAQGFRAKSCGQLFGNVIGAFDGFLLRVSKKCLGKEINNKKCFAGECSMFIRVGVTKFLNFNPCPVVWCDG